MNELFPEQAEPELTDQQEAAVPAPAAVSIVVLDGDETGQELLQAALGLLNPEIIGISVQLERYDLSLENRRRTNNGVVADAASAMLRSGFGIKAATITPEGSNDVGSPNRLLREAIDGKVIIRTGRRIPGTTAVAGIHHPISVVRMAVGDAYGAEEWREGESGTDGEIALRTERITRGNCRALAEYTFRTAKQQRARVYGGPKWTVSPVYEAMLKEELDQAAQRHPEIPYQPALIDATYAGLVSGGADAPLVIPALNRDGDCLSDLVLSLYGTIAGAESLVIAFDDEDLQTKTLMAEAPHGTAPGLMGRDVANPLSMVLALSAVLRHAADIGYAGVSGPARAIHESALEASAAGIKTIDLGGSSTTTDVIAEIASRTQTKLEIWSSLGRVS